MKNKLLLFFLLIGFSNPIIAQKKDKSDIWSGKYVVSLKNNDSLKIMDTLTIERTIDVEADQVAAKYESDLARWTISSSKEKNKEKKVIRRFLFDPEDKTNEYEEFGWTDLHKEKKMNCIDGGNFFICQTLANSQVNFSNAEIYFTKTGIFGIWLHYGVVELRKIKM